MTDEKQVEVELYGIKALLPPGAEPYIVAYALECDPSFHKGDKIERALANYEHWHWPPIARIGFARIMRDLWWDYTAVYGDTEPDWEKSARQERLWTGIVRAIESEREEAFDPEEAPDNMSQDAHQVP